jgi:hypothetical protein
MFSAATKLWDASRMLPKGVDPWDNLANAILRCNIVAPFDNGPPAAYSFGTV